VGGALLVIFRGKVSSVFVFLWGFWGGEGGKGDDGILRGLVMMEGRMLM